MKRVILSLFSLIMTIGLMAQPDVYTPTLKSPADSAENRVPNLTLSWNAVAGSLNLMYQLQIDTSLEFSSPLKVDTTQLLLTGYVTHELRFGQKYYWRVRAIDGGQTSYWSTVWFFIVLDQATLSKPSNNQTDQSPNVSLEWKNTVTQNGTDVPITGIRFWDYQLDSVNTFDSPFMKEGTTTVSVLKAATSNLLFNEKYYYRVRIRHNLDTTLWCPAWAFTIVDKVTLQAPNNDAKDQSINAQIRWKNVTGLLGFEYQLALDQNFTNLIFQNEVDTNMVNCSMLLFGEKVYWRIRCRSAVDTSSWSNPRNFTVINSVILKFPTDTLTNVDIKPKFQWTGQTGITGYELQLDSTLFFLNPVLDYKPNSTDLSYTMTKKLQGLKTYYWRMRAFSDGSIPDTTAWSEPWSFTTTNSEGIDQPGSNTCSIYPNPAGGKIFVKTQTNGSSMIHFDLVDLLGKTVLTRELTTSSGTTVNEIALDNMNKGIYIIRLTINGKTINQKLIVNR